MEIEWKTCDVQGKANTDIELETFENNTAVKFKTCRAQGKANTATLDKNSHKTTFKDVAGCDEAKVWVCVLKA